jgi:hypothetical protein
MADQMVSDPYAHLRASASERAKHTVARTENGIRAIRARGETVTARSLERETGLTFKSIQRNVGAYELYKGGRQRDHRRIEASGPTPTTHPSGRLRVPDAGLADGL